jgi:phosphoribosylanthranilate isomerase
MVMTYSSSPYMPRVKICGLTRTEDVHGAVAAGADAVGFVGYPKSPRYVGPDVAATLASLLPPFVTPVLLTVNASRDDVAAYLDVYPGFLLQFHGDEIAEHCEQFGNAYLKVARVADTRFDFEALIAEHPRASGILVDAWSEGYGGAGTAFDWTLLPKSLPKPLILSGGLHAANVEEGVRRVRPWAVDVSSGVERSKGIKDAGKMRDFVAAVRAAALRAAALSACADVASDAISGSSHTSRTQNEAL